MKQKLEATEAKVQDLERRCSALEKQVALLGIQGRLDDAMARIATLEAK